MATQMIGKARRVRKVDPNGNIYYDRGVSDIIFDPVRGISVKQDIDELRKAMAACLAFVAANPKGMDGKSAYQIALDNGYVGSESDWIYSLKGDRGSDGLSAYEIAVTYLGFDGTEEDFIDSLKGEKGERGYSNYDLAVQNGYTGSEEDWIDICTCDIMSDDEIQDVYDKVVEELNSELLQEDGYMSVALLSANVATIQEEMKGMVTDIESDEGTLEVTKFGGDTTEVPVSTGLTISDILNAMASEAEDGEDE
jgi:predicted DNA-binding ArsR family transcriptional regulator